MQTSSRFGIQYPSADRSDTADVPRDFISVVVGIEANSAMYGQGTLALRPTSTGGTPGIQGRFYVATDQTPHAVYYDFGTGWDPVGAIAAGSIGTTQLANGAVTAVKIGTDVPVVPVGGAMDWPWAAGSIPAWTALPYGQLLTQAAFPAMQILADAAARPYGGVAGTNFNMPDYRGSIGVGKDDMGGVAANRITLAVSGVAGTTLGAVFGAEGITLTTAQLPAHNHGLTGAPGLSDPTHAHSGGAAAVVAFVSGGGGNGVPNQAATAAASTGITVSLGTLATSNAGSGSAHRNTQPSIIVNKIMRVL